MKNEKSVSFVREEETSAIRNNYFYHTTTFLKAPGCSQNFSKLREIKVCDITSQKTDHNEGSKARRKLLRLSHGEKSSRLSPMTSLVRLCPKMVPQVMTRKCNSSLRSEITAQIVQQVGLVLIVMMQNQIKKQIGRNFCLNYERKRDFRLRSSTFENFSKKER